MALVVTKTFIIVAILIVSLRRGDAVQDDKYCRKEVCPAGMKNIGCGCDGTSYGDQCAGKNPRRVVLNDKQKALVLKEHNVRRNMLACGTAEPHPPGSRMTEVIWDKELEFLADCNSAKCVYGHDQCRSTSEFPHAGQNIAAKLTCGKPLSTPEEVIITSIDVWFTEYKNTTLVDTDAYPRKAAGGAIGHFTVMSNDNVRRLGCSYIVFEEPGRLGIKVCYRYYFVCNYSYNNFIGKKTYCKDRVPAKNCAARSAQYSCLCDNKQPLYVN